MKTIEIEREKTLNCHGLALHQWKIPSSNSVKL